MTPSKTLRSSAYTLLYIALLGLGAISARATGLVVTPGDNVGIGTTSPTSKLTIVDTSQSATSNPGNAALKIYGNATDSANPRLINFGYDPTLDKGYIQPVHSGTGGFFSDLILNPNGGNIGIGTTSPNARLEIKGTTSGALQGIRLRGVDYGGLTELLDADTFNGTLSSYSHEFSIKLSTLNVQGAGSNPREFVHFGLTNWGDPNSNGSYVSFPTGNVGIGTMSPSQLLHVYSTGNVQETIESASATNYVGLNLKSGAVTWQLGNNSNCTNHPLVFQDGTHINVSLLDNGNVGIGMLYPNYKLDVAGTIHCGEIITNNYDWADYVFDKDYKLAPLSEVEKTIKEEKHLPGIPSAGEVAKHGVDLGKMQAQLLQKIEELTLHQIEQEKRISQLEKENAELLKEINK